MAAGVDVDVRRAPVAFDDHRRGQVTAQVRNQRREVGHVEFCIAFDAVAAPTQCQHGVVRTRSHVDVARQPRAVGSADPALRFERRMIEHTGERTDGDAQVLAANRKIDPT